MCFIALLLPKAKDLRLLILDNYDSFTYNLLDYFTRLGVAPEVHRNDAISLDELGQFDRIVLSPGPGLPATAGIMPAAIARYGASIPMLGVCLGHQAICQHFGGQLKNLSTVYHGQTSSTHVLKAHPLFEGIASPFESGHYHSWVVDESTPGEGIEVLAVNEFGWVMAVRHVTHPLYGVQFHPESIMTGCGMRILENWLNETHFEHPAG